MVRILWELFARSRTRTQQNRSATAERFRPPMPAHT
jgi:hypothetical protein